jgi:hypothetical protein
MSRDDHQPEPLMRWSSDPQLLMEHIADLRETLAKSEATVSRSASGSRTLLKANRRIRNAG